MNAEGQVAVLMMGGIGAFLFFRRKSNHLPENPKQVNEPPKDQSTTIDRIITVNEMIRETLICTRISLLEKRNDLITAHQAALERILQENNKTLERLQNGEEISLELLPAEQRIELVNRFLDEEQRKNRLVTTATQHNDNV
jgi:hypothetical protein